MLLINVFVRITLLLGLLVYGYNNTTSIKECHKALPAQGDWLDYPPYWIPKNCYMAKKINVFDEESTQRCMSGRTVYTIGNSVARQMLFGLVQMLGGEYVKRSDQRDLCPKHETTWSDSCHEEYANVKLKYLFIQFIDGFNYTDRGGFPYIKNKSNFTKLPSSPQETAEINGENLKFWIDDNCINYAMKSCLQNFFHNATKNDILIFSAGMSYAFEWENSNIDFENWLRKSASMFHEYIKAIFPGKVFRFTNSQTRDTISVKFSDRTPFLKAVDEVLWDVWKDEKEWYTISQWAINEGRDHLYNDHVHWNGPLTFATLHQVLNTICPGEGLEFRNDSLAGSIIHHPTQGNTSSFFLADNDGCLHRIIGNMSCLPVLKATHPAVVLTTNEVKKICKRYDFRDICIDRTLVKGTLTSFIIIIITIIITMIIIIVKGTPKSVYMIEKGVRRELSNVNAFVAMGFEFSDVISIDDWTLQQIPVGAPIT